MQSHPFFANKLRLPTRPCPSGVPLPAPERGAQSVRHRGRRRNGTGARCTLPAVGAHEIHGRWEGRWKGGAGRGVGLPHHLRTIALSSLLHASSQRSSPAPLASRPGPCGGPRSPARELARGHHGVCREPHVGAGPLTACRRPPPTPLSPP